MGVSQRLMPKPSPRQQTWQASSPLTTSACGACSVRLRRLANASLRWNREGYKKSLSSYAMLPRLSLYGYLLKQELRKNVSAIRQWLEDARAEAAKNKPNLSWGVCWK